MSFRLSTDGCWKLKTPSMTGDEPRGDSGHTSFTLETQEQSPCIDPHQAVRRTSVDRSTYLLLCTANRRLRFPRPSRAARSHLSSRTWGNIVESLAFLVCEPRDLFARPATATAGGGGGAGGGGLQPVHDHAARSIELGFDGGSTKKDMAGGGGKGKSMVAG